MPGTAQSPNYKLVANDPHAFATTLVTCLVDAYGTEALEWSPQTLRTELAEDWGATWPGSNFDRLMAGIALVTSNSFYKSLPDFIELCLVLSGAPFTPTQWVPADADDCAWGVTEALLLAPPESHDDEPFTPDIRHYVGEVLRTEGIVNPPDILRIALSDVDAAARVHENFSDDAVMSEGIWQYDAAKTEDINQLTKERLELLVEQLANLHLRNGDTGQVASKMLANLKSRPAGGSPLPG